MNILFFSHDGKLGDAVLHSALVAGVKEFFPEANIYCTTSGATTPFWKRDPRIRESWVVERRISYWKMLTLGLEIRKRKIDYIIGWNTITSTRLKILCLLVAPRHGTSIFTVKPNEHASIKERNALRLLGCNTNNEKYSINPATADYTWNDHSIYFNLFTADPWRDIPVDMAVSILDALAEIAPGKTVYITCYDTKTSVVDGILSATHNRNAVKVDCTDDMDKLISLCSAVDLVITPDSAPSHMASAFNKPVIAVFRKSAVVSKTGWHPKSDKYYVIDFDDDTEHMRTVEAVAQRAGEIVAAI